MASRPRLLHPDLDAAVLDPAVVDVVGCDGHFVAQAKDVAKGHAAFYQLATHGHGAQPGKQGRACRIALGITEADQCHLLVQLAAGFQVLGDALEVLLRLVVQPGATLCKTKIDREALGLARQR